VGSQSTLRPQIAWGAVDGATGYQVQVDNLTTKATNLFKTAATTSLQWTPTADLASGNNYRVWVRAVQGSIAGPWSPSQDFSVAVAKLSPSGNIADLRPTLSWSGISGASYRVRVDDLTAGLINLFPSLSSTTTSVRPTADLISGHKYQWFVSAKNASTVGGWSAPAVFTELTPVKTGPTSGVASLRPTLSWQPVAGATRYEVRVNDVTGKLLNLFPSVRVTGTSWTPPADLVSGRVYSWIVRAVNSTGAGAWSPLTQFATGKPTLSGPSGTVSDRTPTFTWTAIAGATTYWTRLDDLTAGTSTTVRMSATTWTPSSGLIAGHQYRFWVAAMNSSNLGTASLPLNLTIV
jgi:hypothetical protein